MLDLRKADRAERTRGRENQGAKSSIRVSEVRTRSAGCAKSQTTKRICSEVRTGRQRVYASKNKGLGVQTELKRCRTAKDLTPGGPNTEAGYKRKQNLSLGIPNGTDDAVDHRA